MIEKPKTSTIDRLSEIDKTLVNKLLTLCSNYYDKVASPIQRGPHRNPEELDRLKGELLLMILRVGERLWYPRGNPGSTTSLNMLRISKTSFKNRKRK